MKTITNTYKWGYHSACWLKSDRQSYGDNWKRSAFISERSGANLFGRNLPCSYMKKHISQYIRKYQ